MKPTKYGKRRTVAYRRKRELKTDYKARLGMLKSRQPRLVIRKSNNNIVTQIIDYHADGDKILVSATAKDLAKLGWKSHPANMPSAYLTGMLLAKKALKAKIKEAIVDFGLFTPKVGGKLYAAVKGAVEGGLKIPHDAKVLPSNDRVQGKHIADYASKIKSTPVYQKQFSACIKAGFTPEDMPKSVEQMKKKISEI